MSDFRGELSTEAQLLGLLSDQLLLLARYLTQTVYFSEGTERPLVDSIAQQRKELLGR